MRRRDFNRLAAASALGAFGWPSLGLATARSGTVQGVVTVNRRSPGGKLKPKRDHSNVVVYLEGLPLKRSSRGNQLLEIRQVDQHFKPAVAIALVGSKISFPNDDKVYHNVYSNSEPLEFDLGLYKQGTTKMVTASAPGRVEVFCNIHREMRATVLVLDTRYYSMTAKNGAFEIRNVPIGTYGYVAWQRDGEPVRGEVTVTAGATAQRDVSVIEGAPLTRHLDKDSTPIGRY